MDGARKHAVQNARAVAEQAAPPRSVEGSAREVARLAAERHGRERRAGPGRDALVTDADEVRSIARPTARAVAEQADALASLGGRGVTRQTESAAGDRAQRRASRRRRRRRGRPGGARAARVRAREIATAVAIAGRSRRQAGIADEVSIVTREDASLRTAREHERPHDRAVIEGFDKERNPGAQGMTAVYADRCRTRVASIGSIGSSRAARSAVPALLAAMVGSELDGPACRGGGPGGAR